MPACPLCEADGGELIWRGRHLRVVLADEPDYPGFTRVIWQAHQAEMTDLADEARDHLMRIVFLVERVQRDRLAPDKINLASFGNMVPHLHWHVIPRWRDDRHFPQSVWSQPAGRDESAAARVLRVRGSLGAYRTELLRAIHEIGEH